MYGGFRICCMLYQYCAIVDRSTVFVSCLSECIKTLTCVSASVSKLKNRFPPLPPSSSHFFTSVTPLPSGATYPPSTLPSPLASCSSHSDPALFFWPALILHLLSEPLPSLAWPPLLTTTVVHKKNCPHSTMESIQRRCIKVLMFYYNATEI